MLEIKYYTEQSWKQKITGDRGLLLGIRFNIL